MKRDDIATTARQLRLILEAIERGELEASATERARLEGAAAALDALAGNGGQASSPSL
ncbi:hypothetical protein [Mycobacterium paragordonae]|uniref:hypothetical protein n=1 Tax=Mycobacterium paragordonae TaxID=1389713 RepID=UPI0018CC2ACB|nr:hypothetical protein [Mycobacterium paragordonae]